MQGKSLLRCDLKVKNMQPCMILIFIAFIFLKVRWIGGFGQIGWLKNDNWLGLDINWQKKESSMH